MSELIDTKIVNIKNTFLPNFRNEFFCIEDLITGLKQGFFPMRAIPKSVRDKVQIIIEERTVKD